MTDDIEKVEEDDGFFEEDLEDIQVKAAKAFETGDIDDELDVDDPEVTQTRRIREPEGDEIDEDDEPA